MTSASHPSPSRTTCGRVVILVGALLLTTTGCGDDGGGSADLAPSSTSSSSADAGTTTTGPETGTEPGAVKPVIAVDDGSEYRPALTPDDVVDGIDNPYLPWRPGSRWVFVADADGEREETTVVVSPERRMVMGISATVVHDVVRAGGQLKEDTYDWYAQDREGTVWYLGEDTKEYEDGRVVSTAGSWESGVDGVQPGIVMWANPEPGPGYRQEYLPGEAEDRAQVIRTGGRRAVGSKTYEDVVVIKEWTALEPDVVEEKVYVPGVGEILSYKTRGGEERADLVSFREG